jgi:hypothetical protein
VKWADVASVVGKSAPILGTLLGGPAGGAVGALIASALGTNSDPDAVSAALTTNPDAVVKLREIEANRQVQLQGLVLQSEQARLAADAQEIMAVNATMQAETKSEHWASWLWRPVNGFVFAATFFGVYFVLPLSHIPVPVIPFEAWTAMGAILGVASWFRGKAQADPANPAQVKG